MEDREAEGIWETRLAMTELGGMLAEGTEKVAEDGVKVGEGVVVKEPAEARPAKRREMEAALNCIVLVAMFSGGNWRFDGKRQT